MAKPPVHLVLLRRPMMGNAFEHRSDPFWECGSFGCTGCHSRNLLHANNVRRLQGARLAFGQGGKEGFRLVFVTPPIRVRQVGNVFEAQWEPAQMPFKYAAAPVLAANDGRSDVPLLKQRIAWTVPSTWESKLASCFRSKASPLPQVVADQMIQAYERARAIRSSEIADCYADALPYAPPEIDGDRGKTYRELVAGLVGKSATRKTGQHACIRN